MKALKILVIVALVYAAIVVVFESLLGYFQPEAGYTMVISTFDADGTQHDRVLSGLDSGETLYVAVNHWPRAWYRRALENPAVLVNRGGETKDYRAMPISDVERNHVATEHPIPLPMRFLMGFAPRHFLRLDPVTADAPVQLP